MFLKRFYLSFTFLALYAQAEDDYPLFNQYGFDSENSRGTAPATGAYSGQIKSGY